MKALVIEDEIPAAKRLRQLVLEARPAATILDTLDSVEGAVRWLRTFPAPDLIFMDIQIADGLSFDIFRQVEVVSPVIFTTAFDQYAVQAFRVNAVDYLLKPIDPTDLENALVRLENTRTQNTTFDYRSIVQLLQKPTYKDRFLVKNGQQFVYLNAADIAYFRSSEGLTQAYTFTGKKFFVEHSLEELERLLDPNDYFRVSRGLTIRLNAIQKIQPHLNGRLKLGLTPTTPDEVFVSRERAGEFKVWLGG